MRILHPGWDFETFKRFPDLSPVFSYLCALFCTHQNHNSFVFKRFRTLCAKHPGWGTPFLPESKPASDKDASPGLFETEPSLPLFPAVEGRTLHPFYSYLRVEALPLAGTWVHTLMRRRLIRIALILLLFPPLLAAVGGWLIAPGFLTPIRRELTPDLIREADASFAVTRSQRDEFDVRAPDGVLLRGWRVMPPQPNGSWVLLFHGVADNRVGVIGQSEFLLRAGYSVIMMDARAHGASEGPIATYGWLERNDTRAIVDAPALFAAESLSFDPMARARRAVLSGAETYLRSRRIHGRGHRAAICGCRSAHRSSRRRIFLRQSPRSLLRLCRTSPVSLARQDSLFPVHLDAALSRRKAQRPSRRGSFTGQSSGFARVSGSLDL